MNRIGRLVLDTSAYSHFRARHEETLETIAEADVVLLPVTVLGELSGGFELGQRRRENWQALSDFLDEPFVSVLPTTSEVAEQYGRIYATLRRAGTPIPANDMWIAAATIDSGGQLMTFDRDFRVVPGLRARILTPHQP